MMKAIQIIAATMGLFVITSGVNTLFAKQSNLIPHGTAFSCSANSECKKEGSSNALFSGPSGTGKTFIGETEKNLSRFIPRIKK